MFSLEGTLKTIAIFFAQLLHTIIDPCFRTKKFIKKIQSSPQEYINPLAFVFITGIVLYYFKQVASEGFLSVFDPRAYINTFKHFQKISITDALLASLPFVLFTFLFLFTVSFLLFAKNPWRKLFMRLYVYWFSSSLLTGCLVLLIEPILSFLLTPYNKNEPISDSSTLGKAITGVLVAVFFIAAIAAVISIVMGIVNVYYKANRSLFFRLLAGWLLSFGLFYFIYLPLLFSERFEGKVVIMDQTLSEYAFHLTIQDTATKKVEGFLFIDNQVDRPILISTKDTIELLSEKMKTHPDSTTSPDNTIKLGLIGERNEPALFIKPGDVKLIHVQGYAQDLDSIEKSNYDLTLLYKTYPVKQDLFTSHQFTKWKTSIYLNR